MKPPLSMLTARLRRRGYRNAIRCEVEVRKLKEIDADSLTFDRPRPREVELQFIGFQFKIRSGFRSHFDEGREVALEAG